MANWDVREHTIKCDGRPFRGPRP